MQVDLADEWGSERLLEDLWLIKCRGGLVQLPIDICQLGNKEQGRAERSLTPAT